MLMLVIQAVIDHVNGGLSVIDEVGLALDHGLDQGVHVHINLVDGSLSVNDMLVSTLNLSLTS